MKQAFLTVSILLCFTVPVSAGVFIDYGFILLNGEDHIVMAPGETVYLKVTHSFWKTPVFTGLEYSSKAPVVAYVDENGWLHAGLPGRTVISVWNDEGDNGTLEVFVRSKMRVSIWLSAVISAAVLLFFVLLRSKNNSWN